MTFTIDYTEEQLKLLEERSSMLGKTSIDLVKEMMSVFTDTTEEQFKQYLEFTSAFEMSMNEEEEDWDEDDDEFDEDDEEWDEDDDEFDEDDEDWDEDDDEEWEEDDEEWEEDDEDWDEDDEDEDEDEEELVDTASSNIFKIRKNADFAKN